MAKKKKPKPPKIDEQIRAKVSELLATDKVTPMFVYDLLLLGHRMFKWDGIPTELVWAAIAAGFADHDRHYLTPGQTQTLLDRPLDMQDLEYLSQ